MAYRFNDFAYLTDLSEIPRETIDALRDLDVLVLDCLRFKEHPTHLWVDKALEYVDEVKATSHFLYSYRSRHQTRSRFSQAAGRRRVRLRRIGG